MPIDLPENFDFSQDQHKLLLLSTLESQQSAITSLRKRLDLAEQARENSPVFPASMILTPDVAATSFAPTWFAVGSDSVSGAGYTTNSLELDEGFVEAEYSILGEESLGAWYGAPIGAGVDYIGVYLVFQIPKGISGWKPNAIEFDWRSATSGSVTTGLAWTVRVAGTSVATGSTTYTGSGAEDTGWTRTVLATGAEMGKGFSITPGTRFSVTFRVHGGGGQSYVGNLHLNWS